MPLASMTAFARASAENDACQVVVEIRSVNNRYLDVRLRAPSALAVYEMRVRDAISTVVSRGKVDVTAHLRPKGESAYRIELDHALMKDFVRAAREVGEELDVDTGLSISDLVGFGPAFQVKERTFEDVEEGSRVLAALDSAVSKALADLRRMSAAEGAELQSDLAARVRSLAESADAIERLSEKSREGRRAQLQAKVSEIAGSALEPSAMAMEVARLVERSDITEEIIRFRSHVTLWESAVASHGPCGKKLDFIVQEMNREVNTMGSKCQDAAIAERVIAMKAELERVREQVQNVE